MFCTKCGKELGNTINVCPYCGNKFDESGEIAPPAEPSTEQEVSGELGSGVPTAESGLSKSVRIKKKLPILIVIVILLIVIIIGIKQCNSPSAKMEYAIQNGDWDQALEIFDDNFYPEDLSEKTIELLKDVVAKTQEDYLAGVTDYDDAGAVLERIRQFGNSEVNGAVLSASDSIEAAYQIAVCIKNAETYYESKDYYEAILEYEGALSLDPANEEAEKGIEKAKSAYKNVILEEAERYVATGDFDVAENVIFNAIDDYFENDTDLKAALNSIRERHVEQMEKDVYMAADGGDWDGALELLNTYQEIYPEEQSLAQTREDILKKMPITLENVTMVSSDYVSVLQEVVPDRWGNVYNGAVDYNYYYSAYALYNLQKSYTTFTGTAFISKSSHTGLNACLAIYLDEELVYYQDNITEETAPISLNIDVTGATTMRIAVARGGQYRSGSHLCFGNTSFTKAEE